MADVMVYVARRRCGCVVGAQVDDTEEMSPEESEARLKQISDVLRIWIRGRYQVDRVPAESVPMQWFSGCPHMTRQQSLSDLLSGRTVVDPKTGERTTLP